MSNMIANNNCNELIDWFHCASTYVYIDIAFDWYDEVLFNQIFVCLLPKKVNENDKVLGNYFVPVPAW